MMGLLCHEQRVGCLVLVALVSACSDGGEDDAQGDASTPNHAAEGGGGGSAPGTAGAGSSAAGTGGVGMAGRTGTGVGQSDAGRGAGASGSGGAADAGSTATSGAGGTSAGQAGSEPPPIGEAIFPGPPYARPALPARRVATATNGPVCVLLENRSVHCVERYFSGTPRDVSSRVPNNQDYDAVTYSPLDGRFFYAFHGDGSVDTWQDSTDQPTGQALTGAVHLAAFVDATHECGLRDDGTLACDTDVSQSMFPTDPMVDFFGMFKQPRFAALRADGVLVSTEGVFAGGMVMTSMLSWGLDRNLCGVTPQHELYCDQLLSNPDRVELTLIAEGPFRDIAQGLDHVCYVAEDGRATCVLPGRPSPSSVPADLRFVAISTSSDSNTCGVTEQGDLFCWNNVALAAPVRISLPMKAAVE